MLKFYLCAGPDVRWICMHILFENPQALCSCRHQCVHQHSGKSWRGDQAAGLLGAPVGAVCTVGIREQKSQRKSTCGFQGKTTCTLSLWTVIIFMSYRCVTEKNELTILKVRLLLYKTGKFNLGNEQWIPVHCRDRSPPLPFTSIFHLTFLTVC